MRLFTAILFEEAIKDTLYDTILNLQSLATGNFTTRDNLHLTVNFIGETDRLEEVKYAMKQAVNKAEAGSFPLIIRGLGRFKRSEGDIYWVGIEKNSTLWNLQKELNRNLREVGFTQMEDREYKPHLTLGRKVHVNQDFSSKKFEENITPMTMEVKQINLMKSERIQGKLVYTQIYCVKL